MLIDQFQEESAVVVQPFSLCNPVDKNGEGIRLPDDHLVCFSVKTISEDPKFMKRDVSVTNQFVGDEKLKLKKKHVLCVPSTKTLL